MKKKQRRPGEMERCVMFKDWEIQYIKMQIKKKKIPIGIRSKQLK